MESTKHFHYLSVKLMFIALLLSNAIIDSAHAHGMLLNPPNRSSIWRIEKFAQLNPPENYDDNSLSCGGVHPRDDPGSDCGVCGDPLKQAKPRDNEYGGKYYRGIIVAEYQAGQVIDAEVDLTMNHLGHMEFRVCDNPKNETQNCFNRNILGIVGGDGVNNTKIQVKSEQKGIQKIRLQLHPSLRCDHCVMQWNYRAGNAWGDFGDGTGNGANGFGPQVTFRGCSDIKII